MLSMSTVLFLTCLLTYLQNSQVVSLTCARCTAIDSGCDTGNILSSPCEDGAANCYVYNLYMVGGRGQGTYRGCSYNPEEAEGCRETRVGPPNRREAAIVCVRLCDWEGCNSQYGA